MIIAELLLVGPVGYMDLNITQTGPLNKAECPKMTTFQLECDASTFRTIRNTRYCV